MSRARAALALDFQALYSATPGLFLVLSPDESFTVLDASDAYLAATRKERGAVVGARLFDAFPEGPAGPRLETAMRASLERMKAAGIPDKMEVQRCGIPAPGGGDALPRYWSPLNIPVPGRDGGLGCILHKVEDVSEFMALVLKGKERQRSSDDRHRITEATLSRTEEQLRQVQKMEAVGSLAGGVAHDFNNILAVIIGYGEVILEGLAADSPMREEVEQILRAGARATDLTRQLLAFSRQQVVEPKVLDLNKFITEMDKMIRRLIGENLELRSVPKSGLGMIMADAGHVEQVIMNLVVNARDAMPAGGSIVVETANVDLDPLYAEGKADVNPGPYVMLAVSDTGLGMDDRTKARIFEPFFTTKEKGQGTGLGLATVHGIVKQSGGHIFVYSELGKGTTFKVYFPRHGGEESAAAAKAAMPETVQGTETILLVEDDVQIRGMVRSILSRKGYRVLEAKSGADALKVSGGHGETIHVLLTDMIMPKMNGRELAAQLKPLRPEMKVLYMSGYTDNVITRFNVLDAGLVLLQKPFTPGTLLRRIRALIETPAGKGEAAGI